MPNPNAEAAAQRFAENMSKYPIEEQIAVELISKNVLNGCSWEFARSTAELRANSDAFHNSPNVSLQEVTYNHKANESGYLVFMRLDYLLKIFEKEAPGLIDIQDLQRASKHHENAILKLGELMKKGYKGRIGIYCTNDSSTITISGKTFPAFAVTLTELLQVAIRFGYGVVIGNAPRDPNEVHKKADAVLKAMTVAPSSNAILMDIAPMK